jgi:hypothetical protein
VRKLVEVVWVDSFIEGDWKEFVKTEKKDDCLVATYGLLVHKSRDWVVLAMTFIPGKAPYWGALWHIPRGMVVQINELAQVPDEPRKREVLDEHRELPENNF